MTIRADYGDLDWLLDRISAFHREYQHIEREHHELRILLRDAEAALREATEDALGRMRIYHLERRLADLQERHPWIASGKPSEIALWVPSCG
jgi:hypothetical protein